MNETIPNGLIIYVPKVFTDERGYFFETYNQNFWKEKNINTNFVQDNESRSAMHTMRGLHWQQGESAQSKLVRVIKGSIIDFVLDIRKSSTTFGKMYYVYLSGDNKKQFYIPRGFAHGFIALENDTIFAYKCDNFYDKSSECGINMLDQSLNILKNVQAFADRSLAMRLDVSDIILSEKDQKHPFFKDAVGLFN